jgi:hypothetical protein
MKICSKCKIEKEFNEFYKSNNKLRSNCKSCTKEYLEKNKEKKSIYKKEYRIKNKQSLIQKAKEYNILNKEKRKINYQKNKEIINTKRRINYQKNKERIKQVKKIYREKNRIKINEKNKLYKSKRKKYVLTKEQKIKKNEWMKIYNKERKKTDLLFYFSSNVRTLINSSFKRGKNNFRKNSKTETILGCKIEDFRKYIQSKFKKGMTLENQGEWHLDHIIPLATAKTEEDIIRLNHYTNFQPMWATENLSKSDKIIETQLFLL